MGSRTGSGFDIYRGDSAFTALTERSAAWREFANYINSEAFADKFREVFADHLDDIGLRIKMDQSHVDPRYVEPREVLSETATFGDKVVLGLNAALDPFRKPRKVGLFTRLDIHKSTGGYAKPAHCDRPNRLCSLIIYFTDAEAIGMEGGDLLIFGHKEPKAIADYPRHPRPSEVVQVAQLRPQANLGVFFPCQNNSYHGVTPVLSKGLERDFLYINISGRSRSIWAAR
ncbi:MAG TPA: 2OG-Fe(II) oxygenase [Phenylobacterium sp.]|nr:2OG-Fe(II) oxygenase [Phenylobacterium sp.]